jgi:hypothetical protein
LREKGLEKLSAKLLEKLLVSLRGPLSLGVDRFCPVNSASRAFPRLASALWQPKRPFRLALSALALWQPKRPSRLALSASAPF